MIGISSLRISLLRTQRCGRYQIIKVSRASFAIATLHRLTFPRCPPSSCHHVRIRVARFFLTYAFLFSLAAKPPRDSGYDSIRLLKQQPMLPGRPLSLSISTATTYTSSGTDSSSSPLPPPSLHTFRTPYSSFKQNVPLYNVARLAEEEKMDV